MTIITKLRQFIRLPYFLLAIAKILSKIILLKRLVIKQRIPNKIKKITVLRLDHIGDFYMSLLALKALREKYPKAEITLIYNKIVRELVPEYIDKKIAYDSNWLQVQPEIKNQKSFITTIKETSKILYGLIRDKSDLTIDLKADAPGLLITSFARTRYKIDYVEKTIRNIPSFFEINAIEEMFLLLKPLGIKRPKIEEKNTPIKKIGFIPGAAIKNKDWDPKKVLEVVKELSKKYQIYLYGGKREKEKYGTIKYTNTINLIGKTSLKELEEEIKSCDLVISTDTGAMHMAYLNGIPTIALFGPSCDKRYAPTTKNSITLNERNKNDKNYKYVFREVKEDYLNKITPEQVIRAVNLASRRSK